MLPGTPPAYVLHLQYWAPILAFSASPGKCQTFPKDRTGLPILIPTLAPSQSWAHCRCSFMHSMNIYWALTMCQALSWHWDTAANRTDAICHRGADNGSNSMTICHFCLIVPIWHMSGSRADKSRDYDIRQSEANPGCLLPGCMSWSK